MTTALDHLPPRDPRLVSQLPSGPRSSEPGCRRSRLRTYKDYSDDAMLTVLMALDRWRYMIGARGHRGSGG